MIVEDWKEQTITLSSGYDFYANGLIVGIGPDGGVYTGYDDLLLAPQAMTKMPLADRQELAAHMMARWQKFAEATSAEDSRASDT